MTVARTVWPGVRVMLLPLIPVLWAAQWLGALTALGFMLMALQMHGMGHDGYAAREVGMAWVLGSVSAMALWLRRQLRGARPALPSKMPHARTGGSTAQRFSVVAWAAVAALTVAMPFLAMWMFG